MRRVLVHICCGPCSIYPLKRVMEGHAEVWGFFHNPNIHPRSEFLKRLEAVKLLSGLMSVKVIYDERYRPSAFIKGVKASLGEDAGKPHPPFGPRCDYCYSSRLEETARAAKAHGFDAFSSSLLYSRYQDHAAIKALGERLAAKYGVRFIYADFREGWYEGINASREMGLYRQNYCGCIYSRIERMEEKGRRIEEKKRKAGVLHGVQP